MRYGAKTSPAIANRLMRGIKCSAAEIKSSPLPRANELVADDRPALVMLPEQDAQFETERLRQDMQLAARTQRRLFPNVPPQLEGFDIFGDSHSADTTGGDYFDFLSLERQRLGIAIGDVCGHGIASALMMAATRAYVRTLSLGEPSPSEVLRSANRAIANDVEYGRFVTLILAHLDPLSRTLRYSGAGHPPGHILSASGDVKAVLESQGPALGILQDFGFLQREASLAPGDLVLFVTDGIIEAANSCGQLFGVDRALAVVRMHQHQPARTICRELGKAARLFAGRSVLDDDATSIVVRVES